MKLLLTNVEWKGGAEELFRQHLANASKEKIVPVVESDDDWIRVHVKKGHKFNAGIPNEVIAEARRLSNEA